MEGKNRVDSTPSFTSELFGSEDSSSSPSYSKGIFGSIFAPSSKVLGRESIRSEGIGRKQDHPQNESWYPSPDDSRGVSHSPPSRDLATNYHEQRTQPCHLSSSIYYGGQDVYTHPRGTQDSNTNSIFKKDGTDDDSGSASRGNWWQGSLYY